MREYKTVKEKMKDLLNWLLDYDLAEESVSVNRYKLKSFLSRRGVITAYYKTPEVSLDYAYCPICGCSMTWQGRGTMGVGDANNEYYCDDCNKTFKLILSSPK